MLSLSYFSFPVHSYAGCMMSLYYTITLAHVISIFIVAWTSVSDPMWSFTSKYEYVVWTSVSDLMLELHI